MTARPSQFRIELEGDNEQVINLSMKGYTNEYMINGLTSFTNYEISVAIGNMNGFGERTGVMFTSGEDGEFIKNLNIIEVLTITTIITAISSTPCTGLITTFITLLRLSTSSPLPHSSATWIQVSFTFCILVLKILVDLLNY